MASVRKNSSRQQIQKNGNIKKKRIKQKKQPTSTDILFQLIAIIAIIVIVIIAFYQKKNTENYNNIKQDTGAYLVYTKYEDKSTKYTKEVPYVNLKADVFKEVNSDILLFCNDYMNSEKSIITYEYDINGIILSLVVKVINNETEYAPEPYFRTYNINLKTEEVIADSALLEYFNVSESTVENKIKRKFQSYYSEIVKEQYYTASECSYDCFLKWRGITNYLDYVSYYVRDGKLIAYKTFIVHSIFGEEEYFNDQSFEFEIADTPEEATDNAPLTAN